MSARELHDLDQASALRADRPMQSRPFNWRWVYAGVIVACLGVTGVVIDMKLRSPLPQVLLVTRVVPSTFQRQVKGSGAVEGDRLVTGFRTPGVVRQLNVKEGDHVHRHQLLAQTDDLLQRQALMAAQFSAQTLRSSLVEQARLHDITLTRLSLQLAQARHDAAGASAVYAVGGLSAQDLGKAQQTLRGLELDVQREMADNSDQQSSLRQQLAQAQENVVQATRNLQDTRIYAPVDGTVSRVGYNVRQDSGAGSIELYADRTGRVRVDVPEAVVAQVKPGQAVQVNLLADGPAFSGRVSRVASVASATQGGNAVVPVTIRISPWPAALKPGLSTDATITTLTLPHATVVPIESVVQDEQDPGVVRVWVVDADRTVHRRTVTMLARNTINAAVSGLKSGELVVRSPGDAGALRDGITVTAQLAPK
ncbi:efflux RND transporter periplasmic adaptor subunit [Deinococcus aquiradiocola]|uniref:RND transporter n=1 Tax=Deinococcus aquiradiocola TaxID=393059 RepID=A0A917UUW9_9DEIO|nr:HlyD family efflux transporter periplasmic adaptor subunit [Deinococcus aquiradiocola]GGJ87023.1 RND transporter [Deinococcus aquiradiocola]